MTRGRPLIGLTTGLEAGRQTLDHAYVTAVDRAGGVPVLLPMHAGPETLETLLQGIDGLLVPGGPGITAGLCGALPDDLPEVAAERWQADVATLRYARARSMPVLSICYGMQLLNALAGGTLYGDICCQVPGAQPHSPRRNGGQDVTHGLRVEAGTVLARLVGDAPGPVNSFHLQAVAQPGAGMCVSARSGDGLVEAIEADGGRQIGVQFHPERLPDPPWPRLFEHLVEQARPAASGAGRSQANG